MNRRAKRRAAWRLAALSWLVLPILLIGQVFVSSGPMARETLAAHVDADDADARKHASRPSTPSIQFNRDIRPILSNNCFECHGPDSATREAGLRFDIEDAAKAELRSGHRAIVPGEPSASELIRRITSDDPDVRMPPAGHAKSLTSKQIDLLRRWISEGALWQPHWAFIPPTRPEVPEVGSTAWSRNAIDRFIVARLAEEGLSASPEADRATLLRRVTLDLTGLPPTPEALDEFLSDAAPNAYERAVDRLLASPRYGEHMARCWLDAARYGDTHGLHLDNRRSIWPYRDWVIRAFNANMPFDQFTIEQLAGDLLPDPDVEQLIATGFNRCNVTTSEGGAIDAEYLVKYAIDRAETTATVWMGMTAGCAACHDHKFDPLSQREFYEFYAFFYNVDENAMDGNAPDPPPVIRAPTEAQRKRLASLEEAIASLRARIAAPNPEIDAKQATWEASRRAVLAERWTPVEISSASSSEGATMTTLDDGSILVSGENPARDTYEVVAEVNDPQARVLRLEALTHESLPHTGPGRAANANFVLSEISVEARSKVDPTERRVVRFVRAIADHSQAQGGFWIEQAIDGVVDNINGWAIEGYNRREARTALFLADTPFGYAGGATLHIRLRFETQYANHAIGRFRIAASSEPGLLRWLSPVEMEPWRMAGPYSFSSYEDAFAEEAGPESDTPVTWGTPSFKDGVVQNLPEGDNQAVYLERTIVAPDDRAVQVSLGSDDAIKVWLNDDLLRSKDVKRAATPDQELMTLPLQRGTNRFRLKIINASGGFAYYFSKVPDRDGPAVWSTDRLLARDPGSLTEADRARLRDFFRGTHSPVIREQLAQLKAAEAEADAFQLSLPVTLVMKERAEPRQAHVLVRGDYERPDDAVMPGVPSFLPALPVAEGDRATRLDLARWLVSPGHPLTARVTVNRFWQQVFGTGLVRSSEDFGSQGEQPSHPALLDWLAVEFIESGWDVKQLMKTMVMSATYRQQSHMTPTLLERDPANRLLARGPRYRLDAEVIRDQALAVSGLLVNELGGPGVRPYQPPGLWKAVAYPTSDTAMFERDSGDALYRRSIYTFWKRTSPPPNLTTFDAPTRESCVVRRPRTNTPLQMLVLLNDTQFVEAARSLGERVLGDMALESDTARLERIFVLTLARRPDSEERETLLDLLHMARESFVTSPSRAEALIGVGESPVEQVDQAPELAAWTVVANTVMALDEAITRE